MKLKTKLISGVAILSIFIITICSLFTYISVNSFSRNVNKLTTGLSEDVERDVSGFSGHYAGTLIYLEGKNMIDKLDYIVGSIESSLLASKKIKDQTVLYELFESYVKDNSYINSMYVANNKGLLISYPNNVVTSKQISQDWFQKAKNLKTDNFFISNLEKTKEGKQIITISTPIFQNGSFYGVISADLNTNLLNDYISQIKVGQTGFIALVGTDQSILAHKDANLLKESKKVSEMPFFQEINEQGNILLDIKKVNYLPLIHEKTGWTVLSVIPQEEIKSFTQTIGTNMSNKITEANQATSSSLSKLTSIQIIVIIFLIILAVVFSWLIARYFINPINSVSTLMESVSNGDLSRKLTVKSNDEIGNLLKAVNKTIDSLRDMVNKINALAYEVNKSSSVLNEHAEVTSSMSQIVNEAMSEVSKGAEHLSTDMYNVSNNIEQNAQSIHSMSESLSTIAQHARETKQVSTEGKRAMEKVKSNMDIIVKQAVESSSIMKSLDMRLQQISDITRLIHDISEQTNLLSLNASIEAARAGEHGKGFAVVAQEVKKLAMQSSNSVDKVSTLISEIQNDSSMALENIDLGRKSVEEGSEIVNDSERNFHQIVRFIDQLSTNIESIAATADNISNRSTDIYTSIERVTSISQTTTAGVEEVTGTTDEQMVMAKKVKEISSRLHVLTDELKHSVDRFRL